MVDNYTFDIAWRHIIGLNFQNEDKEDIETFRKAVSDYTTGLFALTAILNFPGKMLLRRFLKPYRARDYLVSKISKRIDELKQHGPDNSTLSGMVFADSDDDNQKLSKQDIIENVLILLVAGTETTSSTLTSAIFMIGLHNNNKDKDNNQNNVWSKLVQEQQMLCAKFGQHTITKDILSEENAPYLNAVIKETLRIVPVSGTNTREAKVGMELPDNNDDKSSSSSSSTGIPKGAKVFPNIRLTHELDPVFHQNTNNNDDNLHNNKSHMDPITGFKPERWLLSIQDEGEGKGGGGGNMLSSEDFIPFGFGPRRCLGANLAMAEMQVFLALLARNVIDFELLGVGSSTSNNKNKKNDDPIIIEWNPQSIIPKPVDGVPIKATTIVAK